MKLKSGQKLPRLSAIHAGILLALAGSQVHAQEAGDANAEAESEAAKPLEEIYVLGTRRTDRSVTDSASPVDFIGTAELKTQPAADMLEVLKNVVPSFNVQQNQISDASTFVRAPSLRGLAGDMTLVMINGKRLNRAALVQVAASDPTNALSQGADLAVLPSIAFGGLQILREGATAQYGTDAIAGVINYSLKKEEGVEINTRYGQYLDDGGDGDAAQVAAYLGVALGESGFISLAAEYNDDGGTFRNETRPAAVLFAEAHPEMADQLPNYPDPVQLFGTSPADGWKSVVNFTYDVTEAAQIYAFGNFAHSEITESFNFRSPESFTAEDTAGVVHTLGANGAFAHPIYLTACPAGNATCPAGGFVMDGNTFSYTEMYPAGFTPQFVGEKGQAYGVAGVKGNFSENLTYDFSASVSKNELTMSMYDSLSPTYGPDTQSSFEFGTLIQEETVVNSDFVWSVDAGLTSPLTVGFGAEYREETYEATEGDEQSYGIGPYITQPLYTQTSPGVYAYNSTVTMSFPGASGYGGTSPDAANAYKQHNYAAYVSVEADLTESFSLGVAGRFEDYNTFGNTTVGKVNALWEITPTFSLRGTVGTGFHAPSPGQSNVQILTTAFTNGVQVQTGTYPVTNPIAQYFGATALKPEESTNFGLGFVFEPLENLTVTLDAYVIEVSDRIGLSQTYSVTAADIAAEPALLAVGEGGDVQYPTSAYDSRTTGLDFVGTYRSSLGSGSLDLSLAYNYNDTEVTAFDADIIGDAQRADIEGTIPKHRATLVASYAIGDFTLTARENFYSSFSLEQEFPGQTFSSKATTDLEASYTFDDTYTMAVGASNLFNTYPDKIMATEVNPIYVLTNSLSNGQVYPNGGGPFGSNGGFWYARVNVKF
ncbi:MAG TPA: TonB-dependent receptor [Steroidobacteraceae bacterium]|nr:TonB-dependent receptor [Steroidobacteraceae bacterium]